MNMKRAVSSLLLFLCITISTGIMISQFDKPMYAEAAVKGLDRTELFLYEGDSETLNLNGIKGSAKWSSSDKSIATVSSKGRVTGKKKGTAVITAKVKGKKYKCKVTVDKIVLNYNEKTLKKGKSINLSMINSDKKVMYPSSKVKWVSSDTTVASVNNKGSVQALAAGTTTITGTMYNGKKASCKINVEGVRIINNPAYLSVGDSIKINYVYVPPTDYKEELVWTIEYDTGEDAPVVPYSFDMNTKTLTALSEARNVTIYIQSDKDLDIGDVIWFEIVDHLVGENGNNEETNDEFELVENRPENPTSTDLTDVDNSVPMDDYNELAANSTPTLRSSERFIIDRDCAITIFDAPILYLPQENWDIWEKFYYTLDGTTPTTGSTRFNSTIYLDRDCTLKMIGVSGNIISKVLTVDISLKNGFYLNWGTNPEVDIETCMYAIKNNVSDLSVLNDKELELYHKAKQILADIIRPGMTDYDKLKAIHDYICRNVTYSYSPNDQDAYGALVLGKSVCMGYSGAFQLLAGLCDIHCMSVYGFAGGAHSWNLVKLDGEWYHVDCNSDDIDSEDRIQYRFFLIDDAHFPYSWQKTEFRNPLDGRTYAYPAATGTKYHTGTYE